MSASEAAARVTAPIRGVVLMVCGAALITANDAVSKYLAETYPIGQVVCLRQAATLLLIAPYALLVTGAGALRVTDWTGQLTRGALFTASAGLMVTGLSLLPLATVTVIVFSSPIFVAVFSASLLGEKMSPSRWIAILAGFAGIIIALRPVDTSFEWALIIPLAAALANGLRDIVTRRLARTETSIAILLWSNIIVTVASLTTSIYGWEPVTAAAAAWFVVAGVFNASAHFLMIEALRLGAAAVIAPFRYTGLIFAVLIGLVIWHDIPDLWVLAGGLVIVAGGIVMMHGERRRKRL